MTDDPQDLLRDLEYARERFDDIVRLTSDWVWEVDTNLDVTMISERVTKVLGYQPAELTGRRLSGIAENEAGAIALDQRLATMAPFRDHRFEARGKNGQARLFLVSGVPIFSNDTGTHTGFRGAASDITDLVRREQSLIQARDNAEMASRAKADFLSNMSHELRTPLNSIIGFADLLIRETVVPTQPAQMREYGAEIKLSASHLLSMINDILDLSKIEAGKLALNEEEISVPMLCEPVLRMIRERALHAGLTLSATLDPALPLILVDHRLTRQILLNLLSNAVKFTPEHGKVDLRAFIGLEGELILEVEDTGIGIAEKDFERVLEPFIQVESHHARRFGGTGLGLALSRRLAELHGGRLSLVSKPGYGTKVLLHIPSTRFR